MVSPERRRAAAQHLQAAGIRSQRRACECKRRWRSAAGGGAGEKRGRRAPELICTGCRGWTPGFLGRVARKNP